jgi:uncharacterized protein
METNPEKIKALAEKKTDINWEFRSFLKQFDVSSDELDSIVHRLYNEVSSQIDCTQCANCCNEVSPILDHADIEKFAGGLTMPVADFQKEYLQSDVQPGEYIFKTLPCPFLTGNRCSNYECRPKDCVSYPHLHKDDFIFRLMTVVENCAICPIAYNVYELLKTEYQRQFKTYRRMLDEIH